jgi:hypothetical protein
MASIGVLKGCLQQVMQDLEKSFFVQVEEQVLQSWLNIDVTLEILLPHLEVKQIKCVFADLLQADWSFLEL